jgi:hypothetical protein
LDMLPGTEATAACRFLRTRAQGLLSPSLLHPLTLLPWNIDVLVIASHRRPKVKDDFVRF